LLRVSSSSPSRASTAAIAASICSTEIASSLETEGIGEAPQALPTTNIAAAKAVSQRSGPYEL
jgi:hypothetical protein